MSRGLLGKFPDSSAYDFDYCQSGIWSPVNKIPSESPASGGAGSRDFLIARLKRRARAGSRLKDAAGGGGSRSRWRRRRLRWAALLTPTQRYAAGALLALALRQAQIHQSVLLGSSPSAAAAAEERASSASGGSNSSSSTGGSGEDTAAAAKGLWTHDSRVLLRPVFRFLEIDPVAWPGLEETAASPEAKHHIGAFLRMIFEEDAESSSDSQDQEHALAKGVDVMVMSLSSDDTEAIKEGDEGPSTAAEDLLGIDKLSLDDVPATDHRKMTLLFTPVFLCVNSMITHTLQT